MQMPLAAGVCLNAISADYVAAVQGAGTKEGASGGRRAEEIMRVITNYRRN